MSALDDILTDWRGPLGETLSDRASKGLMIWSRQVANPDRLVHFFRRSRSERLRPGDVSRCGLVVPEDYEGEPRMDWAPGDMPCARCSELLGYLDG